VGGWPLDRVRRQAVAVCGQGGLDLGKLEDEAEKQEAEKAADEYKELLEKVKGALGDKVKDVRVTYRLTDSPSCLVSDQHDPSGNLARLLKAAGQKAPDVKPILEINPQHPAVMRLKYEETRFDDWAACCSSRQPWPKVGNWMIRPGSSNASTI
jgi:molecular chaperone HtpG